jgi:hypothetical protein
MSLRQRISSDIAAGRLTHSPLVETSADRIGALARSDALGAALWRILGDHDEGSVRDALGLMVHRLRKTEKPKGRDLTLRMCWVVLQEWLANKCKKCHGRGLVYNVAGVADACSSCGGTALRHHSDTERARGLGVREETCVKWSPLFAKAHGILSDAESRVGRGIAYQLERGLR